MAEIFILSPEDELLAVLSSDGQDSCNFWDAKYKEELNLGSSFSFIADASHPDARYLFEENQVVFRDKDGFLRAFVIKELDDTDDGAEINTLVTCEAAMMELAETIIKEKRPKDKTAQYVLDQVFERTRWTAEVTAELGINSTSFYKMTALECLSDVLNKWGGEFKDVVEFDGNTITKRTIKVLSRRGKDSGKRFEIDKDTESIRRTVISYPKTALYGYGASLQTTDEDGEETGGYSRFIDFADVEWKKSNGDPVDKPKGQEWVGDPALLQKYGRLKNGELIHREDIYSDEDIEDPEELLKATYNHLITVASKTEVNYELSVKLLEGVEGYEHEHVDLGDTTIAIDRNFAIPIETSQRIISMEYDITDPENTCVVEIGQFLSALQGDDRVKQLQKIIDNNRGTWERKPDAGNVTDGSFPNTKPPRPSNIKAEGLFKTVSLTWDYNPSSYIAAYEVYASQNKGFTPTAAQLIFRGKTGGWHHQDGVDVDQVWYYRFRTINTHGTPSDWSGEYEAKTVRVLNNDIMFGAVTADKLAALSVTADKLYTDIANSNILPGSLFRSSDLAGLNGSAIAVNEQEYNEVTITKTRTNNKLFGVVTDNRRSLKLVNGETYTFSIEVKRGNLTNFNYLNFRYYSSPTNLKSKLIDTPFSDISNLPSDEFVRLDCTFTYTGDTASNYFMLFGAYTENVTDAGSFVVRKCQLRMGEAIKEWSASPYDVMLTEKSVTALHVNDAAIGTAAIQNAAIQKAHLGTAIIDTAHITDGAITNAKIANLSADKITAGTIKGITIEGSLIKGARIEPISQNWRYNSYITANEIYQEYYDGKTNVLTIKDGVFQQSYKSDEKVLVGGTTIDKGSIKLEGGSGTTVSNGYTYRSYLYSDWLTGSGYKMAKFDGKKEIDTFFIGTDYPGIYEFGTMIAALEGDLLVSSAGELTVTSPKETILNNQGTNIYIKGEGTIVGSFNDVSTNGNFNAHVSDGYFAAYAAKGFLLSSGVGYGDLRAHTIDMYSGNQTRTLLRAAGVWHERYMNSLQTNCQIIFDNVTVRMSGNSGSYDYTFGGFRNIENVFNVFLQVEGSNSSAVIAAFENKTTSGFRIYIRNAAGIASANDRNYTVNIMMITEAI
ncbi:prophage endopeptidase tail family protein [Bacillus pumilus]|uniref:prophage endopeptidase tail family protein n=1 Tax=Bacillus pumilus TaxID=1408 RepID=UPI001E2E5F02|nr:prophage endopeptidase tail family protein [Bacillus pumilus]MCC9090633.1 phage tail protein [Bacillus pumilus]